MPLTTADAWNPSRRSRPRLLAAVFAALAAGCTWIELTDAGADVMQATRDEAAECRLVGTVTSSTQDRVLIRRGRGKVAEELIVLARNEAATLGGNTIVPLGEPVNGRQDFEVYTCHPR
jgi:hypothetical protein